MKVIKRGKVSGMTFVWLISWKACVIGSWRIRCVGLSIWSDIQKNNKLSQDEHAERDSTEVGTRNPSLASRAEAAILKVIEDSQNIELDHYIPYNARQILFIVKSTSLLLTMHQITNWAVYSSPRDESLKVANTWIASFLVCNK